jgi:quinoprotein glucose dehydrogenase
MSPEQKVQWKERLKNARKGFYTPLGLMDTVSLPSVNGGALFFSSGADPTNGTVYVESKDMPSIMKLVAAGESTAANTGGTIPSRPAKVRSRDSGPFAAFTPEKQGRAVFEQDCQVCHGAELKGDRGPAIDTAVKRLGSDGTRAVITNGRAGMPAFPKLPADAMSNLLAFLGDPEAAPPGSAAPLAALRSIIPNEPEYPSNVTPPPSRYKTGYGNESYIIKPPWTTLTAYDLNTGTIKWKEPYGDLPEAGPSKELRGNVYPKSGFVVTAGGLIMYAGNDSKLYVIDKDTGKLITAKDLPNGSLGQPAVYQANGREYILLAVSGGNPYPEGATMAPGGVTPPATEKCYISFALPEAVNKTTN